MTDASIEVTHFELVKDPIERDLYWVLATLREVMTATGEGLDDEDAAILYQIEEDQNARLFAPTPPLTAEEKK